MIMHMNPVFFVSLGPGDPELITLKGLKAMREADIIFCPETLSGSGRRESRAASIVTQAGIDGCKLKRFLLPMSRNRGEALKVYDRVYDESSALQGAGRKVCIVAEGDAGFYSSVHYVFEKMRRAGIPAVHIAGIPAFIAAGALGGLHVASGDRRLTVIPGNTTAEEISSLVADGSTVVVMKLSQCSGEVHRCIGLHPEFSYDYFANVGTTEEEHISDHAVLAEKKYPYFSLMVIGVKQG